MTGSASYGRRWATPRPRAGADRITYLNGAVDGTSAIMRLRRDHGGQASGGEDLPLLRGGPTIRFTYAGNDGEFLDAWGEQQQPAAR